MGAIVFKWESPSIGEGEPSVLIIRRGTPPNQGRYSLPGGRVQWGETLSGAVVREIFEETSLVVRAGPLVELVELIDTGFHYVVMDYLCIYESGEPKAGDDADEALFVKLSQLSLYGVSDAVARVVSKARALAASEKACFHTSLNAILCASCEAVNPGNISLFPG